MEIDSFSQRISKINGNRKVGRFGVVLKLEFEVKNWYIHTKQLPNNLGAIVGSGNCLVVFHNPFFPFQRLYKLTKISPKFRFTINYAETKQNIFDHTSVLIQSTLIRFHLI